MTYPTTDQLNAATTILRALGCDDATLNWHRASIDTSYGGNPADVILAYVSSVAETRMRLDTMRAESDPQPEDFPGLCPDCGVTLHGVTCSDCEREDIEEARSILEDDHYARHQERHGR